jgi:hypothetical protein
MSETDAMPAFYPSPMDQPPREKKLAGQPQEPWQAYSPPPAENQDTYAYPQPGGQGAQGSQGAGQAYARPAQSYQGPSYSADQPFPGQEPPLTRQDMSFPGQAFQDQTLQDPAFQDPAFRDPAFQGQNFQDPAFQGQNFQGQEFQDPAFQAQNFQDPAFQGQDYPGSQEQAAPQWQAAPGRAAAARAGEYSKGFFGSLFDFGFNSFVTPKIIKALYVLYTIWMVVWAIIFIRLGFKYGGVSGGIFTLVIVDPIFLLLTLGVYRVVLEFFVVVHRMHEDLKVIRERGGDRG